MTTPMVVAMIGSSPNPSKMRLSSDVFGDLSSRSSRAISDSWRWPEPPGPPDFGARQAGVARGFAGGDWVTCRRMQPPVIVRGKDLIDHFDGSARVSTIGRISCALVPRSTRCRARDLLAYGPGSFRLEGGKPHRPARPPSERISPITTHRSAERPTKIMQPNANRTQWSRPAIATRAHTDRAEDHTLGSGTANPVRCAPDRHDRCACRYAAELIADLVHRIRPSGSGRPAAPRRGP
jgi:hypothetical protein